MLAAANISRQNSGGGGELVWLKDGDEEAVRGKKPREVDERLGCNSLNVEDAIIMLRSFLPFPPKHIAECDCFHSQPQSLSGFAEYSTVYIGRVGPDIWGLQNRAIAKGPKYFSGYFGHKTGRQKPDVKEFFDVEEHLNSTK